MKRIIGYAFKNIRRSPFQALGSIFILFLTFFAAQSFVLVMLGSQVVLKYFETKPQVTAFFTDQVNEANIVQLKQQLENQTYVARVVYVSKNDALEIYKEDNKNDPLLLEMVTADILPASLEVAATDVSHLPQISEELKKVAGVDEVVYQQDVIEALEKWMNGIRSGGLVLVGFLVATSILITTILISMKVSSKRHEIRIVKLLGATPWFVRGPFIVEGMLYGIISALVSWLVLYTTLLYATPILLSFIGDIPLLPVSITAMLYLLGGSIAAGAFVGSFSGSLSTSRYE